MSLLASTPCTLPLASLSRCWVIALLCCVACAGTSRGCDSQTPGSTQPLDVRFAHCAELLRDGTCQLSSPRELTLFVVAARPEQVKIQAAGTRLGGTRVAMHGGTRITVEIPDDAKHLHIQAGNRTHVRAISRLKELPQLERLRQLRSQGKIDEARAMAQTLQTTRDPAARARVQGLVARLLADEGKVDAALAALTQSSAAAEAAGLLQTAAADHLLRADLLKRMRWDLAGARQELALISPLAHEHALSAQQQSASLALVTGDLRRALTISREVTREAETLGADSLQVLAAQVQLLVLAEVGRLDDGRALVDALSPALADDPCATARLLANASWLEVLAGDATRAYTQAERAVKLFTETCPDDWERQNALVNLAFSAYRRGRLDEARDVLKRARALLEPQGWVRAWEQEIDAAIALRQGRVREALQSYQSMVARAALGAPVTTHFRALLGLGSALQTSGRDREAEQAYRSAEALLDVEVRAAPLGEGREEWAGNRLASAEALVDLLVLQGRAAEALEVARKARLRPLTALALRGALEQLEGGARARWEVAVADHRRIREKLDALLQQAWTVPLAERAGFEAKADELRQSARRALDTAHQQVAAQPLALPGPAAGRLDLYYFPGRTGGYGFARDVNGVRAVPLGKVRREALATELSEQLLRPFAAAIKAARALRVVLYADLSAVDFHTLPFEQASLIDAVPVSYGLDVGAEVQAAELPTALVVFDPRADLPAAVHEGNQVAAVLRQRARTETLTRSAVTLEVMLTKLPRFDWLHFAGHGSTAGSSAFGAQLLLAGSESLEAGDVLTLSRVPRSVVLAGCETGVGEKTSGAAFGMAQAFVMRGAQAVVATQRRVADTAAQSLSRHLYAENASGLDARSVQKALTALRDEPPRTGDWAAVRLYVP